MDQFKNETGDIAVDGEISAFENEHGVVEIHNSGNGIYLIKLTTAPGDSEYISEAGQIAAALSWWRKQTKARILSVAGFEGNDFESASLIVVTETEETEKT